MARARKTEYVEVARQVHGDVVHECVIFFRDPFWYWRISLDGGSSYSKGSTKSRNRGEATEAARAKFYEFKAANRLGIKPSKATVSSLIDRFLSSPNLVLTSPTMADAYRMKAPVLKKWFKDMPPHKVTGRVWQDYLSHRLIHGEPKHQKIALASGEPRRLSRTTLDQERQLLRQALRLARDDGLIIAIPDMVLPKFRAENSKTMVSRPSFTEQEMLTLYIKLNELVETATAATRWNREMLRAYVMFSYFTGIRPNDAKVLRWGECQLQTLPTGKKILVLYLNGKGLPHASVVQPQAWSWLKQLRLLTSPASPHDLVFPAQRKDGPYHFVVPFRNLLKSLELLVDEHSRVRTCYSLRHAHAMRLVTNPKINLAMLAKNLGTSVEMLMRHYCSHIHVHEHADIFVNDPRGIGAHSFQFDPRLPMVAAGEMTLRSASMLAEWDNMAGLS